MLASLRVRLLLTLLSVMLVSAGTQAVLASQSTTNEFQQYVASSTARDQQVATTLLNAPLDPQNSAQVAAMLKKVAGDAQARFVASDSSGRVIADSDSVFVSQSFDGATAFSATIPGPVQFPLPPLPPATAAAGSVPILMYVAQPPGALAPTGGKEVIIARVAGDRDPSTAAFLGSVNRSLLASAAVTGLAALLLALLLARGIVGPVEALTRAARRMEKGDLRGRVTVRARGEIGELAHAFNAMADGLARLEKLRRNMVTDVAHELRTPLANLRGYLEALRDGVVEPSPALLDSLHEEALLLTRLVEDLQEIELAEAGQLRLERRPVALDELIGKAVQVAQPAAAAKGVTLAGGPLPALPKLDADPDRLGQVLRNLLSNAIAHTPAGGRVAVTALARPGAVELRVADSGDGIPPEQLPHIFDRFFRGDPARARATGGAGLGLAIVQALVAAHGGQVRAESDGVPGHGSTLIVQLPRPGPQLSVDAHNWP